MNAATEVVDDLIVDIQKFLSETSLRDLFSAEDLQNHLLDFMNKAEEVKTLLS